MKPSYGSSEKHFDLRRLARIGLLTALSAVGAMIKFPTPLGTPALDAVPGYLAAFALGPLDGALVTGLGNVITTLTGGAPLGLLLYSIIAVGMAGCGWLTGWSFRRWGYLAAMGLAIVANALVLPAIFIPIPQYGLAMYLVAVGSLLPAAAVNVILAAALHRALRGRLWP